MKSILIGCTALFLLVATAGAVPITDLVNTGQIGWNVSTTPGGCPAGASTCTGTGTAIPFQTALIPNDAHLVVPTGFGGATWNTGGVGSWITAAVRSNGTVDDLDFGAGNVATFVETFNLTGAAASLQIVGNYWADGGLDHVTCAILIDSTCVFTTGILADPTTYAGPSGSASTAGNAFSVNYTGPTLAAGNHTISFAVRNGSNELGFKANFTETAFTAPSAAIPEPGTYALMALGLGAFAALRRRKA